MFPFPDADEVVGDGGVVVVQGQRPGQIHGAGREAVDQGSARRVWDVWKRGKIRNNTLN